VRSYESWKKSGNSEAVVLPKLKVSRLKEVKRRFYSELDTWCNSVSVRSKRGLEAWCFRDNVKEALPKAVVRG